MTLAFSGFTSSPLRSDGAAIAAPLKTDFHLALSISVSVTNNGTPSSVSVPIRRLPHLYPFASALQGTTATKNSPALFAKCPLHKIIAHTLLKTKNGILQKKLRLSKNSSLSPPAGFTTLTQWPLISSNAFCS